MKKFPRNWRALSAKHRNSAGSMGDRKKEESKKTCRGKIMFDDYMEDWYYGEDDQCDYTYFDISSATTENGIEISLCKRAGSFFVLEGCGEPQLDEVGKFPTKDEALRCFANRILLATSQKIDLDL